MDWLILCFAALQRERDELLALLDIQERQRYEFSRSSSVSSEDNNYNGFTSTEVGIRFSAGMHIGVGSKVLSP